MGVGGGGGLVGCQVGGVRVDVFEELKFLGKFKKKNIFFWGGGGGGRDQWVLGGGCVGGLGWRGSGWM